MWWCLPSFYQQWMVHLSYILWFLTCLMYFDCQYDLCWQDYRRGQISVKELCYSCELPSWTYLVLCSHILFGYHNMLGKNSRRFLRKGSFIPSKLKASYILEFLQASVELCYANFLDILYTNKFVDMIWTIIHSICCGIPTGILLYVDL
jgi:hypothetical protein